jgi:flagellum-specific ATP synthase
MVNVGAYVEGKNPKIDYAISKYDNITDYLNQGVEEESIYEEDIDKLIEMMKDYGVTEQQERASVMK